LNYRKIKISGVANEFTFQTVENCGDSPEWLSSFNLGLLVSQRLNNKSADEQSVIATE